MMNLLRLVAMPFMNSNIIIFEKTKENTFNFEVSIKKLSFSMIFETIICF